VTFAVKRALCEQYDISIQQSVDDRREELKPARETAQSGADDSESLDQAGGFEFPAASQYNKTISKRYRYGGSTVATTRTLDSSQTGSWIVSFPVSDSDFIRAPRTYSHRTSPVVRS
jgi:hypothetical protein